MRDPKSVTMDDISNENTAFDPTFLLSYRHPQGGLMNFILHLIFDSSITKIIISIKRFIINWIEAKFKLNRF